MDIHVAKLLLCWTHIAPLGVTRTSLAASSAAISARRRWAATTAAPLTSRLPRRPPLAKLEEQEAPLANLQLPQVLQVPHPLSQVMLPANLLPQVEMRKATLLL